MKINFDKLKFDRRATIKLGHGMNQAKRDVTAALDVTQHRRDTLTSEWIV